MVKNKLGNSISNSCEKEFVDQMKELVKVKINNTNDKLSFESCLNEVRVTRNVTIIFTDFVY